MSSTRARLYWVDYLRTFMILLVVNMHACVACSHVGSWYYMVDPEPSLAVKVVFAFWQGHLQAFFMGLLFFLAGYFADRSLERRGARSFLAERALRLGAPTLLYMLVIHPFILLGLNPWHDEFPPFGQYYAQYLLSGRFVGSSGPLWFTFALLLMCLCLVGVRVLRSTMGQRPALSPAGMGTLRPAAVLGLGVALALASFLVRTVQPVGTNVLNFQLCYFPQYLVAFGLGVVVSRRDALRAVASAPVARRAGQWALVGGPLLLVLVIVLGGKPPEHGPNPYSGGWHWQALGLALWEQVSGVGLALGAMAWFARHLNRESGPLQWLSDRSFGVYVLHAPILVALTMLFLPLHAGPFVMAALLTVTALAASFLAADLARRIPGLRAIL